MKNSQAFQAIRIGDTEEMVSKALGNPESKLPLRSGTIWCYQAGRLKVCFKGNPPRVVKTIIKVEKTAGGS